MASTLSKWLVDPKRNPLAALHMKTLKTRLSRYGLRYDDLHDPMYDLDVKQALDRLPKQVVDARNQRLKRAMDLSMKHQYLPEDLQAMQTPFRSYLQEMLALVQRETAEREALGALPLYQRTLP
ncbi:cytochrome b-c1 complex subunit 7 [Salvia miltiorrhiza]|uniref:cytochrome b-c1 complex subunit 7 n=1 Tax=Salvia miltiorrhiza TaxID=226208 RepID=UPI0025AD920D|nr:cytochrome b-c1 complex subunit 7 [Salvia miltiorrhiza]XP_057810581.1 cytochrome b-c1 complex subunit 7 [Salvia miltiorrhiza]